MTHDLVISIIEKPVIKFLKLKLMTLKKKHTFATIFFRR